MDSAAAPYDPSAYQSVGQPAFVPADQPDSGGTDYWGGWNYASTPVGPAPDGGTGERGCGTNFWDRGASESVSCPVGEVYQARNGEGVSRLG